MNLFNYKQNRLHRSGRCVRMIGAIAALLFEASALASGSNDAVVSGIEQKLATRFPDIKVSTIVPSTDLPGYYEVITPTEIVYVDASGERLLVGRVMNTKTRENMTAIRWNELNRIDFKSLPFDKAIKVVKGDGRRVLAVFEDPLCPYCIEFEHTLQEVDNVTVYVFLYPLEGVHPGASDAARDIWCADNHDKVWVEWMVNEKTPPRSECATPTDELVALGERLKINSTPTLIFPDGIRVPGAVDKKYLEAKFDALYRSNKTGSDKATR